MVEVPAPAAADQAPQVIPFSRRPAATPPATPADANRPAEPNALNTPNAPAREGPGLSGISQGVIGGQGDVGN